MTLTSAQRRVLERLTASLSGRIWGASWYGWRIGGWFKVDGRTLNGLRQRGFVELSHETKGSHGQFQHYRITDSGRRALAKPNHEEGK